MRVSQDPESAERGLRERVGRELARHKIIASCCGELHTIPATNDPREILRTVQSISGEFRRSSADLRRALDTLRKFLTERIISLESCEEQMKTLCPERDPTLRCELVVNALTPLARARGRLAEREDQLSALLEDGLRLAFEKEALEVEMAELRKCSTRAIASAPRLLC